MKKPKPDTKTLCGLDAIQELMGKPIEVRFTYNGQACQLEARLLDAHEAELLKLQADALQPAVKSGKTPDDDRLDLNAEYLAKRTALDREIRAQGVFWCVPELQAAFKKKHGEIESIYTPGLRKSIKEFVQKMFCDDVLDVIWSKVSTPEIKIAEQINLSSPGGENAVRS